MVIFNVLRTFRLICVPVTTRISNLDFCMGLSLGLVLAWLFNNFSTSKIIQFSKEETIKTSEDSARALYNKPNSINKLKEIIFDDQHLHHDDDTIAQELSKQVRVLCWIMTSPKTLETKTEHVKKTWGKRCNILLFFSSVHNKTFPTIGLNVSEGRDHLTAKTMQAFQYVYEHYYNEADWFMKADDDTYAIVENLRYFLSSHSSNEPVFFGHRFKVRVKQGFYSGGAGYVLSKEALKRFATRTKKCREDGGAEDVEMGRCLESVGVRTENSTDKLGRSRFHCFNPENHLVGWYPDWYYKFDARGAQKLCIIWYMYLWKDLVSEPLRESPGIQHERPGDNFPGHYQSDAFVAWFVLNCFVYGQYTLKKLVI